MLPALLYLELDGNRATKAKEGPVEVPAHTGAPKFSTGTGTPERLRRRREEQVGGPGKLLGTRTASVVSLRFVSAFCGFETALCLNTIISFITNLALLRESYTLTLTTD